MKTRLSGALSLAAIGLAASSVAVSALAGEVQVAVTASFTAPVQAIAAMTPRPPSSKKKA